MRVSMAFFHVPHLAMGGELSRDYVERSRVMSYSSFFGWMGGALVSASNHQISVSYQAYFANLREVVLFPAMRT